MTEDNVKNHIRIDLPVSELDSEILSLFGDNEPSGFVDIVSWQSLNAPTLDCFFHNEYDYKAGKTIYYEANIYCQASLAYINYSRKLTYV